MMDCGRAVSTRSCVLCCNLYIFLCFTAQCLWTSSFHPNPNIQPIFPGKKNIDVDAWWGCVQSFTERKPTVPPVSIPNSRGRAIACVLSLNTCSESLIPHAGWGCFCSPCHQFYSFSSWVATAAARRDVSWTAEEKLSWRSRNAIRLFVTACYPRIGRNQWFFISVHWIDNIILNIFAVNRKCLPLWSGDVIHALFNIKFTCFLYLGNVAGLEYAWCALYLQLKNLESRFIFYFFIQYINSVLFLEDCGYIAYRLLTWVVWVYYCAR